MSCFRHGNGRWASARPWHIDQSGNRRDRVVAIASNSLCCGNGGTSACYPRASGVGLISVVRRPERACSAATWVFFGNRIPERRFQRYCRPAFQPKADPDVFGTTTTSSRKRGHSSGIAGSSKLPNADMPGPCLVSIIRSRRCMRANQSSRDPRRTSGTGSESSVAPVLHTPRRAAVEQSARLSKGNHASTTRHVRSRTTRRQ